MLPFGGIASDRHGDLLLDSLDQLEITIDGQHLDAGIVKFFGDADTEPTEPQYGDLVHGCCLR